MKLAMLAWCVLAGVAMGQPVEWRVQDGGNGHWYEFIQPTPPLIWDIAQSQAQAMGADLVSINSAAENAFVEQMVDQSGIAVSVYVGGHFIAGIGWRWVDGTSFTFTDWGSGACTFGPYPNSGGRETALGMSRCTTGNRGTPLVWDDQPAIESSTAAVGRVIEYSADCNGDGIVDKGQILNGQFADTNNNGRLDICECTAPSITSQPVVQSVCSGAALNLSVTATGTSPQFQWRKDGSNISGATSAIFTVSSASVADSGSYDCVVSNACGSVTSAAVSVVVRLPQILSQPTSQNVNVDQPVFFAVETNTASPCQGSLNFRWQRRNALIADPNAPDAWIDLNEGGGFVGTSGALLGILRPTPGLATGYRCKITNACGCEADANGVIYTDTVNYSAACPSDFNLDGSVDGDDVIMFFERWDIGC